MNKTAFILFIILASISASGQSYEELAAKAARAYDAGHYSASIELYQKILDSGMESPVLYYRLGDACYRNNDMPSAILYYEKALKLDPNNRDLKHNLALANSKITDKVEIVPELFYKRWWKALLNSFTLNSIAVMLIVLLILSLTAVCIYLTSRVLTVRKLFFWSGMLLFLLFFITLNAARQKAHYQKTSHEAIVFTPTLTVKSSPDQASTDLFVIHEGIKVTLLDKIGEWQEIRIANGSIGWLRTSDLRMI